MHLNSLYDVSKALRNGRLSTQALMDSVCAAHDPALNAYRIWDVKFIRRQAQAAAAAFSVAHDLGPLQGIPVSVKDLFGVNILPCYAGTRQRLPQHWQREGAVIRRLRRQLGVISGKTQMGELALGGLGMNPHWGTPRNPWDAKLHRVPGGSSSGAGLSLWEGTALLALGSDTGGSVRVPAGMTGTVGLKISAARWPLDGMVPLSPRFDSIGLLGRRVADVAYGFAALDPRWGNPAALMARMQALQIDRLRLGMGDDCLWEACSPGVVETLQSALDELSSRGAHITGPVLPEAREAIDIARSGSVVAAECDAFLAAELPQWYASLGANVAQLISESRNLSARELLWRQRRFDHIAATDSDRFKAIDAIVCPTVPITPPTVQEIQNPEEYQRYNRAALRNTVVASFLELCAITLPVGLDRAGMPVGLQLMGEKGAEERLLAVAMAVEQVLGTARRRLGVPSLLKD